MTPRVAVLLSTYNGARWLDAQLESLAAQTGVEVAVFARDDGSRDETCAILARWSDRWPALAAVASGPNLGPAASFLALLRDAPDGFDAYAFCDQDDVWRPDKLARATTRLSQASGEALYCSRVLCVDEALHPLGPSPVKCDGRFEHLLYENIAFGVTVVMNAAAARRVRARPPGRGVIMHDWWSALVVSAFGEVIWDEAPGVLYRQHGGNEIGQAVGGAAEFARQVRNFLRAPGRYWPVCAQAAEFRRLWGDELDPARRALLDAFVDSKASLGRRLAFAASGRIVRESLAGRLAARALIAAGLY